MEPPSAETGFRRVAKHVLESWSVIQNDDLHGRFWAASRELEVPEALQIIEDHRDWWRALGVRTVAGAWRSVHSVLMPGHIVPGDGTRDDGATVDLTFHEADVELLRKLGVTDGPEADRDLSTEPKHRRYLDDCRDEFHAQPGLEHRPWKSRITFRSTKGVGPVAVLEALSEGGRAQYTEALLGLEACFSRWCMRHEIGAECRCPEMECEQPAIRAIQRHGRIRTPDGIVPFEDALGVRPANPAALHVILGFRNAERIKEAFKLAEIRAVIHYVPPEKVGQERAAVRVCETDDKRLLAAVGVDVLRADLPGSLDARSVVAELQDKKILARADHEIIEGGEFEFGSDDLELIRRFADEAVDTPGAARTIDPDDPDSLRHLLAWLPPDLERRIAADTDRTRRIIERIERCAALPEERPVLVFATSVEHAQTVAAALELRGVTARSVSSKTGQADRTRAIEGFRRGEIRVLVNYNVLTEGFDAPKTRAIVVARPVYSPNLYFQMIGRGLRGPCNGGADRCLVLNVQDNFGRFGHTLAFAELDWLWDR